MLSGGQAATEFEHVAGDNGRLPRRRILTQRRLDHRRPFEHQPFRRADHAVDDRALQQLAGGADIHPAETGEPAARMQRLQEPHRIGAVRDRDVAVQAAGAGKLLAGVGAESPALVDSRSR